MFGQAVQFNGDSLESSKLSFLNQTGQQLVPGQVYALDLTSTNPNTVSTRTRLSNLVGVLAANLQGILIVAEQPTPAGQFGLGTIMGLTQAFVNGGVQSAVSEVQTIAIGGTLSAGTYQIAFFNSAGVEVETAPLAFGASLATVQTALDAVSGGASQIVAGGTAESAMTLTFSGNLYTGKKQPMVQVLDGGLTGVTTTTVTRTTEGIGASNAGGTPGTRLKAVAGQSYLTACDPGIGNTDCCIALLIDSTFAQLSAPGNPTLAAITTGGAISGGVTVFVEIAWQGAGGITTPSGEVSQVVAASAQAINSVSVTTPTAPAGATSAIVYAGLASGAELQVGAINVTTGQTATFIIQGPLPAPASAPAPQAVNTTGTQLATVFFCGFAFLGTFFNPALT